MGNKPVPEEYGPGKPAPVEVRFFDQFWQSQVASCILAVERSKQTRKHSIGSGLGLYEREGPPVSVERGVNNRISISTIAAKNGSSAKGWGQRP